jgi:hypothetical protein
VDVVDVAVVVAVVVAVDVPVVDDVCVDVEFVALVVVVDAAASTAVMLVVGEDWPCAYAPIPPEIRTSIAATVSICSLPVSTFMFYRVCCVREPI